MKKFVFVYLPGQNNRQEGSERVEKNPIEQFREDFERYYRALKWLWPIFLLLNAFILYLLFAWIGIKTIGVILALLIILKEVAQFLFLRRVQKRIFAPILTLKQGVEEVAKGNYSVRIQSNVRNEIGLLINSFNQMAQKLQESEKLKSEYEKNRKALIANISHDLKTPITSIQGYIDGIVDGVVTSPEKVDKYLKIIYQNTEYMNKLIDDLFLFSKLDLEKLDFKFEEISVRAFMKDVMDEFHIELEEKECEFSYLDSVEDDPLVAMDRKRIYQAIRNIMGNAVKYGAGRELKIYARLTRENEYVRLDIEDNGPGIPADKLPYIFERFYRVDTERTKDLMSTGLGLAIAKELIHAHKGTISAVSAINQGSCFTIKLPIVEGREQS